MKNDNDIVTFEVQADMGAPVTILLNKFLNKGCTFLFHSQRLLRQQIQGVQPLIKDSFYFQTTLGNFEKEFQMEYQLELNFQFTKQVDIGGNHKPGKKG